MTLSQPSFSTPRLVRAFTGSAALAACLVACLAPPSMFASAAVELSIADCTAASALPLVSLTEDVHVFLEDSQEFACDTLTTINIAGPYTVRITSDNQKVVFSNLRLIVSDGAHVTFNLANEEDPSLATFKGTTAGQGSDGGVFYVEEGSSMVFMVDVAFEGNSVAARRSGGAVYAGGSVEFQYPATFSGNTVLSDGDVDSGNGGALAVGPNGDVVFKDRSFFDGNVVESGGQGAAIDNMGVLNFKKRSSFTNNVARENGDGVGALGGALYTGKDSYTLFERRTIMHNNSASEGGALYNVGTTVLNSKGFFRGNRAAGGDAADGGHVHTTGNITISKDVNFREGSANRNGGAVFIGTEGSLLTEGVTTFDDNSAFENCDNVYLQGESPLCQN